MDTYPAAQNLDVEPRRRLTLLIGDLQGADALLRVLGVLAVKQAPPVKVAFDAAGPRATAWLEIDEVSQAHAEHLRLRLLEIPCVKEVTLDWR